MPRNIIVGQPVSEGKLDLAKSMRRNMTPTERMLWQRLRDNRLMGFHFRRQQVIYGYIADFYCHRAGLVVEVDGGQHDPNYDRDRDKAMADLGIAVLRFPNHDVIHRMDWVLSRIKEFLGSVGTECPPPFPPTEGRGNI